VHLVWGLVSRKSCTFVKPILHTLSILQHVWAHHTCHRESIFAVVITMLSTQHTEHKRTSTDNTKDSAHDWASRISLDNHWQQVTDADKSLARPGRKQDVSVRMAWISFGASPCRKRNLMTIRVPILSKSRASLTCCRACFPSWSG
jgi:uncharacterized membrane protein